MNRIALFLSFLILLVSCREDIVIDEQPLNPYGVVFENGTKGQLYIQSKQLVMGMPEVLPGETSVPVYGDIPKVSITYFGEGTYFKKIQMDIVLTKDEISKIVLVYPKAP